MKVVTVTLNPAIDQTITLERLSRGAVHRASAVRFNAGGKGVNVASCLADWGVEVAATGLLGAENAGAFEALFRAKGIEDRFVRVPGATRTNLKLVDAEETTDVNLPGLEATPEALAELDRVVEGLAGPQTLFVLSGSLPAGCAPDTYGRLVTALAQRGARVLLDASGAALSTALAGPAMPYGVKPNRHELADWAGRPLENIDELLVEARRLWARGIELVVVSSGAEGALFLSQEGALEARLSAERLASTVGAGDAMVAGIAAALLEGGGLEQIARLSTAFAVAKLGLAGPNLPDRRTVCGLADRVALRAIGSPGEAR